LKVETKERKAHRCDEETGFCKVDYSDLPGGK
jgi:hypothetical protein